MKKRILALLLCIALCIPNSLVALAAQNDTEVTVEETESKKTNSEEIVCTCGTESEIHEETCGLYTDPEVVGEEVEVVEPIKEEIKTVQDEITVPTCNCGGLFNLVILSLHKDSCELKVFCQNVCADMSVTDIISLWEELPFKAQLYIWVHLEESNPEKFEGLKNAGITKPEETPEEKPEDPPATEFSTECEAVLEEFVEAVEILPSAEELEIFDAAVERYADAHTFLGKDEAMIPGEEEAYEASYQTFAEVMGMNTTPEYPADNVEEELTVRLQEALGLYYDAMDIYESDEAATTNSFDEKVASSEEYGDAKSMLDSVLALRPELTSNEVSLLTESSDVMTPLTTAVEENIQIHLFDYGPNINETFKGTSTGLNSLNGGYLPFFNSEKQYGFAVDNDGTEHGLASGNAKLMNKTLENGYPSISTTESNNVKTGSLKYLFSKDAGEPHIAQDTYYTNIYGNQNPYQYQSVHFAINTDGKGEGTGLFQKKDGYFVYDSAENAAVYNKTTNRFDLYDYVVRPAYTVYSPGATATGNFLPFNTGHTQGREDYQTATTDHKYTINENEVTYTKCSDETKSQRPDGVIDGTNPAAYRLFGNERTNEVNLWFGMTVEFDFYMPLNGKVDTDESEDVENLKDMVFEFLGDDDVWVYIDDVLVLDIGGTHGAMIGSINFANGEVKYKNSTTQASKDSNGNTVYTEKVTDLKTLFTEASASTDKFDESKNTFEEYTRHTLKFFYMERGGNISYCKLKFNMDPLPTGALSVEKKVEGINPALQNPDEEFTFQLTDANDAALSQKHYNVYNVKDNSKVNTELLATSDLGQFLLKDGQYAVFTDLTVPDQVKIKEIAKDNYVTTNKITPGDISGESETTAITLSETEDYYVLFTNETQTGTLSLKKEVDGTEPTDNYQYKFTVKFDDSPYTGKGVIGEAEVEFDENGSIWLKKDQIVTISQIPNNTSYTITEAKPENYDKYNQINPTYQLNLSNPISWVFDTAGTEDTITTAETDNVVVTNIWRADLIISKTGISEKDNHPETSEGAEDGEVQSTIFTVTDSKGNKREVVVVGDSSVTLKNMLLDTYTVEETEWSWRYEPKEKEQTANLKADGKTKLIFENIRKTDEWLSGDCLAENIFKAFGSTETE